MARDAYQDGYLHVRRWLGPSGQGFFGTLNLDYIEETEASKWGEYSSDWWDGFYAGLATQRRAA
jgi:hypothetical protein